MGKKKDKDFQKVKFKAGKKLPRNQNVTLPEFKVKKIDINNLRALKHCSTSESPALDLKTLLSRVTVTNANTRKDALNKLKVLLHDDQDACKNNLNQLIATLCPLIIDEEHDVRKNLLDVFKVIIETTNTICMRPFFKVLVTHLCCAMTCLNGNIKTDSFRFLDLLLDKYKELIALHYVDIFNKYLGLISTVHSVKGRKVERKLTTMPNVSKGSKWRKETLERLLKLIKAVRLHGKQFSSEADADQWKKDIEDLMPLLMDSWVEIATGDELDLFALDNYHCISESMLILVEVAEIFTSLNNETLNMTWLSKEFAPRFNKYFLKWFPYILKAFIHSKSEDAEKLKQKCFDANLRICEIFLHLFSHIPEHPNMTIVLEYVADNFKTLDNQKQLQRSLKFVELTLKKRPEHSQLLFRELLASFGSMKINMQDLVFTFMRELICDKYEVIENFDEVTNWIITMPPHITTFFPTNYFSNYLFNMIKVNNRGIDCFKNSVQHNLKELIRVLLEMDKEDPPNVQNLEYLAAIISQHTSLDTECFQLFSTLSNGFVQTDIADMMTKRVEDSFFKSKDPNYHLECGFDLGDYMCFVMMLITGLKKDTIEAIKEYSATIPHDFYIFDFDGNQEEHSKRVQTAEVARMNFRKLSYQQELKDAVLDHVFVVLNECRALPICTFRTIASLIPMYDSLWIASDKIGDMMADALLFLMNKLLANPTNQVYREHALYLFDMIKKNNLAPTLLQILLAKAMNEEFYPDLKSLVHTVFQFNMSGMVGGQTFEIYNRIYQTLLPHLSDELHEEWEYLENYWG